MKEIGSTTTGGRYAEFAVITDYDLDRTVREVAEEASASTGYDFAKVIDTWNFGLRNYRQGQFARERETSPEKCLDRLKDRVVSLAVNGKGDDAKALAESLRDYKGQDDQIVALAAAIWPASVVPEDYEVLIGAEHDDAE